jgi:hypothetical protein
MWRIPTHVLKSAKSKVGAPAGRERWRRGRVEEKQQRKPPYDLESLFDVAANPMRQQGVEEEILAVIAVEDVL